MNDTLVTVFGGSGFLGRHIVRLLAKEGYRLRVAVRRPHLAHYLRPMGVVGQIQLMRADLNDEATIARALDGADAVVNLVGVLSQHGRQRFRTLHAEAPGHIARHAKIKHVRRIIQLSSIGAAPRAGSAYARTKAQGESDLKQEFPDATILRPSIVFGPEDDFFNRFANMARFLPALPLIGGGKTRFQPVFVGDVAAAVGRCLADAGTAGHTYELGGPRVYSFRELMVIILNEIERRRALVPVPFAVASLQALFLGLLPNPILTLDQVRQLKSDNVVSADAGEVGTLADLGIEPTALEAILPSYLWRFRKAGQFENPEFA